MNIFKNEFAQGDRGETGEACLLCRGHRQHGEHEGAPIIYYVEDPVFGFKIYRMNFIDNF